MEFKEEMQGWGWQLIGIILLIAMVLTPGVSRAVDLNVDTTLSNSPFNVGADITFDNENVGTVSTGVMNQGAFTNTVTNDLTLGNTATGSGTYNLSGGSLAAGDEFIGYTGTGAFTQTGGTHTVTGNLNFGPAAPLFQRGVLKSPFIKGGFRGILVFPA